MPIPEVFNNEFEKTIQTLPVAWDEKFFKSPKFANHLFLSELYPTFVPQLVIPESTADLGSSEAERGFPILKIQGSTLAEMSTDPQYFRSKRVLEIFLQIFQQLNQVFIEQKIIINDRNLNNIIVENLSSDMKQASSFAVWQIDMELLYDALASGYNLDMSVERSVELDLEKQQDAFFQMYIEAGFLILGLQKCFGFVDEFAAMAENLSPNSTQNQYLFCIEEIQKVLDSF